MTNVRGRFYTHGVTCDVYGSQDYRVGMEVE